MKTYGYNALTVKRRSRRINLDAELPDYPGFVRTMFSLAWNLALLAFVMAFAIVWLILAIFVAWFPWGRKTLSAMLGKVCDWIIYDPDQHTSSPND